MRYHLVQQSRNVKTGPIPVVTSSRSTCPTSCPLKGKGCYAETGPLALHWSRVDNSGIELNALCDQVKKLPRDQFWRWGQAGDLPGEGDQIDREGLRKLAKANAHRPVVAFTHKPPTDENLEALQEAAAAGFLVNLSADTVDEADKLSGQGLPVVVVLPSEYGRRKKGKAWAESVCEYRGRTRNLDKLTPQGHRLAVCPATYLDTDCNHCRACSKPRNGTVIGFPAHGSRTKFITRSIEEGTLA